jgi:hypothetical protein
MAALLWYTFLGMISCGLSIYEISPFVFCVLDFGHGYDLTKIQAAKVDWYC